MVCPQLADCVLRYLDPTAIPSVLSLFLTLNQSLVQAAVVNSWWQPLPCLSVRLCCIIDCYCITRQTLWWGNCSKAIGRPNTVHIVIFARDELRVRSGSQGYIRRSTIIISLYLTLLFFVKCTSPYIADASRIIHSFTWLIERIHPNDKLSSKIWVAAIYT